MKRQAPWVIAGHDYSPVRECDRTLERLHTCESRPPTDADRPPLTTFPMTRAARAALELNRAALERNRTRDERQVAP